MANSAPAIRTYPGESTRLNLNVSQLLLEYLKLEGVKKIFGVPGGALIYLLDEIKKQQSEIDFVICRHETGAAYMADGYARVSGGLGVVMTTAGPSATNALTGAMNAQASNVSLLTITGEVPQQYFGEGYLQEGVDAKLDVATIYRNAVQYSAVISNQSNFQTLFEQALRDALSRPGKAAHISLPVNIQAACVVPDPTQKNNTIPFPGSPKNYRSVPSGTDSARVADTLDDLLAAKRPLIFLGNGSRESLRSKDRLEAFQDFVSKFGIPIMTTPDAKGIFPETHEWSLRNYGMTACTWPQVYMQPESSEDHYDALLVLGSGLGELATTVIAEKHYAKILIPDGSFTQVDLDQSMIGREFPITRGIVGDVGATLDAMIELAKDRKPDSSGVNGRKAIIAEIKKQSAFTDPAGRDRDSAPLHPASMVRIINELVTEGHIMIDAGNCVGWSLNNMVVDPPLVYQSALDMGPMGFAVASVVGAKMAAPDRDCVAIVGDGAFLMHGNEISTAAQNDVGAVWVVIDDNDLAMVSQGMGKLFPPATDWKDYYKLGHADLARFSEGLGARAVTVKHDEGGREMKKALKSALEHADSDCKPQVVVVEVDTSVMPYYGWPEAKQPVCGDGSK